MRARHLPPRFPKRCLHRRPPGHVQHHGQPRLAPHQPFVLRQHARLSRAIPLRPPLRFLPERRGGTAIHQHQIAHHQPYLPLLRQQAERRRPHHRALCHQCGKATGHGLQIGLPLRPRLLRRPKHGPLQRHPLWFLPRRALRTAHHVRLQPPQEYRERRY